MKSSNWVIKRRNFSYFSNVSLAHGSNELIQSIVLSFYHQGKNLQFVYLYARIGLHPYPLTFGILKYESSFPPYPNLPPTQKAIVATIPS